MISRRAALIGLAVLPALIGGKALAQRTYRLGVLVHGTASSYARRFDALRAVLKDYGYAEGRNLTIAARWNDGGLERLPDLAAELLRENPDAFVCGPTVCTAALQKHTRSVPIVQANGAGMVKLGLAKTFARPGSNATGLETQAEELTLKHFELARAVTPKLSRLAVLNTGNFIYHEEAWRALQATAAALKVELIEVRIATSADLGRLQAACGAKGACDSLYVMTSPELINWRAQIVDHAARLRLPAVYFQPEFANDGGLVSYSADIEDMWRRAGRYVDRILKGAKPADLPIERPIKFELVVNLRTAKSLGLTLPPDLLARADRVIN